MVGRVLLELTPVFELPELSEVFTIEKIEDVPLVLTLEAPVDVTTTEVVFEDVVSPDVVSPLLWTHHFLLMYCKGFVSLSDDVHNISSMGLSFFEYFSASCDDDIASCSPSPPTAHVFNFDDEFLQGDLDESC